MRNVQLFVKRMFDVIASLVLIFLLIVFPVLILIPIIIRMTSKGPAIFTQERVGKDGKIFKIYKFRTMLLLEERIDANGNMLEPNDSITGVGKVLRKTSLDELPQLFNILKGEMSFVGPRPMLESQVEKINDNQKRRHKMRPGVTGLAQVKGRNNLTWAEKLQYDIQYVEGYNLWMDISILLQTIKVVFKSEGIDYVHLMNDENLKEEENSNRGMK